MIYHALEIAEDDGYILVIDRQEAIVDSFTNVMKPDEYAIGTVEADSPEEAAEKIARGDWDYSQKV